VLRFFLLAVKLLQVVCDFNSGSGASGLGVAVEWITPISSTAITSLTGLVGKAGFQLFQRGAG